MKRASINGTRSCVWELESIVALHSSGTSVPNCILDYSVIGETVNLAARLCGTAAPMTAVISAAAVADCGPVTDMRFNAPCAIDVRGVREPVAVYQLERFARPSGQRLAPQSNKLYGCPRIDDYWSMGTPPTEHHYIGFWVRFIAALIDSVCFAVVILPFAYLLFGATPVIQTQPSHGLTGIVGADGVASLASRCIMDSLSGNARQDAHESAHRRRRDG